MTDLSIGNKNKLLSQLVQRKVMSKRKLEKKRRSKKRQMRVIMLIPAAIEQIRRKKARQTQTIVRQVFVKMRQW